MFFFFLDLCIGSKTFFYLFFLQLARAASIEKSSAKKRKHEISLSDSDTDEYVGAAFVSRNLLGGASGSGDTKGIACNLNLAPPDDSNKSTVKPYVIYLGKSIYLESKHFRGKAYLSLYRKEENSNDCKNRFNIELSQMSTLKQALHALESHIKRSK